MKERPILFKGEMVRALLNGSKSQTRRIVKPQPFASGYCEGTVDFDGFRIPREGGPAPAKFSAEAVGGGSYMNEEIYCPYGQPGDRLWVRETFQPLFAQGREYGINTPDWETGEGYTVTYPATDPVVEWIDGEDNITARCKPSIHMPRAASRILLEIVSVRVERLNDISEADARAEGIKRIKDGFERWHPCPTDTLHEGLTRDPLLSYRGLWESINGAGSWAANPWVWVVEFKRIQP